MRGFRVLDDRGIGVWAGSRKSEVGSRELEVGNREHQKEFIDTPDPASVF